MSAATSLLVLNAGSSSLKFSLFDATSAKDLALAAHGEIEELGQAPRLVAKDAAGATIEDVALASDDFAQHLDALLGFVGRHLDTHVLAAVGHRVVHGGPNHDAPLRVDGALLAELDGYANLAPLHQPHNLLPVRTLLKLRPDLEQVVCFDTAFHHTLPAVATRLAIPLSYRAAGVRRYGFHGLSYEYVAGRLRARAPEVAAGRVIAAHLGNGASLCAMRDGRSVDTTMGFTALDGLVMGTRCGMLDPGVVLHLQQAHGLDASAVERLLYKQSGLLGLSGLSSDMRTLLASPAAEAREAVQSFVYRIVREIGALASVLGGLDGLLFTAGIGAHAPAIREAVCADLAWFGVELDRDANARGEAIVSTAASRIPVFVMETNEELMIAEHTLALVTARRDASAA